MLQRVREREKRGGRAGSLSLLCYYLSLSLLSPPSFFPHSLSHFNSAPLNISLFLCTLSLVFFPFLFSSAILPLHVSVLCPLSRLTIIADSMSFRLNLVNQVAFSWSPLSCINFSLVFSSFQAESKTSPRL